MERKALKRRRTFCSRSRRTSSATWGPNRSLISALRSTSSAKEVDRRKLDRLQERAASLRRESVRRRGMVFHGRYRGPHRVRPCRGRSTRGVAGSGIQTSCGSILSRPASQQRNSCRTAIRRACQPIERNRVAVVVENQDRRFLDKHSRDVVEPEVGPSEQAARSTQIEPVECPALPQEVAQVAAPQIAQSQVPQQLDRRLGVAAVERRAIQVILIEQANISQKGELPILEQETAGAWTSCSSVASGGAPSRREGDRRRSGASSRGR